MTRGPTTATCSSHSLGSLEKSDARTHADPVSAVTPALARSASAGGTGMADPARRGLGGAPALAGDRRRGWTGGLDGGVGCGGAVAPPAAGPPRPADHHYHPTAGRTGRRYPVLGHR